MKANSSMRPQDSSIMEEAYASKSGVISRGDTLYISGTRTTREWVDDLTLPLGPLGKMMGVPMGVETFPRFSSAEQLLTSTTKRLVGHSMGGTVALALAQKYGLAATTYAAPVFGGSNTKNSTRYRDTLDPISMFDIGAQDIGLRIPHSAGRKGGRFI